MSVRAWEWHLPTQWHQAPHGTLSLELGVLRAGAIPSREEILAWYAQFSVSRQIDDLGVALQQLPPGARLAAGTMLALVGAYLLWRSFRRWRRPTQAELVRRAAHASRARDQQPSPPAELEIVAPSAPDGQEEPAHRPIEAEVAGPRLLRPKAFLTAEQFTQGDAPWAVPLSNDLLRIGRHQENDIRLEDMTVHRYHALVHRSPEGVFLIRDLSGEAGNGVYVNGTRIEQTQLRPGDLVELGAVRLRFQQQRPS